MSLSLLRTLNEFYVALHPIYPILHVVVSTGLNVGSNNERDHRYEITNCPCTAYKLFLSSKYCIL